MLHQIVITLLFPIISATATLGDEPIVVKDPQPQDLCYIMPARCDNRYPNEASNG